MIFTYNGRPLAELSRPELEAAVMTLGVQIEAMIKDFALLRELRSATLTTPLAKL